ncbi:pilus assembly protein [Ideonella livida]|uniref:Pilus assembly protein PilY n=1 Tax=Ideonella livida TaxID=2707176 RepID=A0A7C9TN11_9BURK|nr:PilC/PilY family type IV pilus protein [Ideonella livida]NDY93644.1 pilus assembly protein PilY [Ideonella livida]
MRRLTPWWRRGLALLAPLVLLSGPAPAVAEDIDLFINNSSSSTDLPNVLIILDNSANWSQTGASGSTKYASVKAALASTIASLPADKFRVGLMLYTETGSGNSGDDGAYVRAAVRTFTAANKTLYQAMVNGLDISGDKSNNAKASLSMAEAYRYLITNASDSSSGVPYAGHKKVKTDYTGNTSGSTSSNAVYALSGNALSSKTATRYVSPISSASCGKTYIIFISNGEATDNASARSQAASMLSAAGGSTSIITAGLTNTSMQENLIDEWARYLRSSHQVITYTVDVDKKSTGQGPGWSSQLQSAANVSGGRYFDVSTGSGTSGASVSGALGEIFSEIQAVNSVFASVSLPVSVNTQGTYLNQVFVGLFRPDQDAAPRWMGNMKQFKLGTSGTDLALQDANSRDAINSTTGFITECARSFWTPSTVDNYWALTGQVQTCLSIANSADSNYPDGNVVEKGGAAYMLRQSANATGRSAYTCSDASCSSLITLSSLFTSSGLTATQQTQRRWIAGQDTKDEDGDTVTTAEMRRTTHGDVVHSRPIAVNYGTDSSPSVVVFYGANDGFLRAINGNRSAAIGGVAAGQELWSFMPPEFSGQIARLYDNSPPVTLASSTGTTLPKPYAMDGGLSVHRSGSNVWLYAGMRRGGRALYSFDVSSAGSMSLRWRIGCTALGSDTDCTTDTSGFGQTWSQPKVVTVAGSTDPLILMGGGYDTCEDADPSTCTTTAKGRAVYVINARTGAVVRSFATTRPVVGEVSTVVNSSGQTTLAYASDLGGNLYRIDIGTAAPASWSMTQVAALGCSTPSASCNTRKFFFGPDVLASTTTGLHYLLVGSGDREKPVATYTSAGATQNYMFMVKDKPGDSAWLSTESTTCGSSVVCLASLQLISSSATPSATDLAAKKGWALQLENTEQVVTSALTVYGTTTFSTHKPSTGTTTAGTCSPNLGTTRVYNVRYANAAPSDGGDSRYDLVAGGGLPPSPVAGKVTLDDGTTVDFIIGASPDSPLEATRRTASAGAVNRPKVRVYRYTK